MSLDRHNVERIYTLIHHAGRILVVTHVDPDGDAIGSLLGLGWLLSARGTDVTLACQDPVPELCGWMPGSDKVVRRGTGAERYDLIVSLDCSDSRRMGQRFDQDVASLPVINIDHHVTNTQFGLVNWVDPSAVATAQMILTLADALHWPLTQEAAVCLLTGLVTDTQGLRTANVDITAVRAALRLMEVGAPLAWITRRMLDQRPLASVRLWGEALGRLHLEGDILWTEITRAMSRRWSSGEDGTTGLTNFLSGVREAKVTAVFAERENGTVDVGMRAVPGCDVAQVALSLGGGGHPQASGCTLEGSLEQVRERVLAEVRRSLACPACEQATAKEGGLRRDCGQSTEDQDGADGRLRQLPQGSN